MSIEIVMSACNDKDTIDEVKQLIKDSDVKLTVYEKCGSTDYENIPLENVGREQHTYAYHFGKNFGNLADYTICTPGNWNKHPDRKTFRKIIGSTRTIFLLGVWAYIEK